MERSVEPFLKDPSSMICQIGPPFASLCPVAGVVPKLGLVQLFPTLLAVISRRGSGLNDAGIAF